MAPQDEVYIISEQDILEPFKKGSKRGPHGISSSSDGAETVREEISSGARRRRSGSGRSGGTRALVASTLSLLVCGAGQVYNGQFKLGMLLFLTEVFAVAAHWSAIRLWPQLRSLAHLFAIGESELFISLAIADFLLVFLMLYNVAQAYHHAEMEGHRFDGIRSPLVAAFASLLVPGWGQLLNAQVGKALFFLFCLLTEVYVASLVIISPLLGMLPELDFNNFLSRRILLAGAGVVFVGSMMWILSIYDAFLVARYRR